VYRELFASRDSESQEETLARVVAELRAALPEKSRTDQAVIEKLQGIAAVCPDDLRPLAHDAIALATPVSKTAQRKAEWRARREGREGSGEGAAVEA
jgi:hypothetical protein